MIQNNQTTELPRIRQILLSFPETVKWTTYERLYDLLHPRDVDLAVKMDWLVLDVTAKLIFNRPAIRELSELERDAHEDAYWEEYQKSEQYRAEMDAHLDRLERSERRV